MKTVATPGGAGEWTHHPSKVMVIPAARPANVIADNSGADVSPKTIQIRRFTRPEPIQLGGEGMLFIPSVFVWPTVVAHADDPWPKAVVYPARGIASLREPARAAPGVLAGLVGRSRARLLLALTEPASTTQLARSANLAIGPVNDHLRLLER